MFRTSADREAALLEQILAPALRSRNPERRKEAVEALENLAAIASHLKHLLLIRDLRKLAALTRPCDLEDYIRDIPDFPKPGIVFNDITPLFLDPEALASRSTSSPSTRARATSTTSSPRRGARVRAGRRRGRCEPTPASSPRASPASCRATSSSVEYELEYGVDSLEVHSDAIRGGARVLVHDDLLATGGTAGALCELVEQAGGVVAGCAFVIELAFLHGRDRLKDYDVRSLVIVDGE